MEMKSESSPAKFDGVSLIICTTGNDPVGVSRHCQILQIYGRYLQIINQFKWSALEYGYLE